METLELHVGMKLRYNPTGKEFEIVKVGAKNVSWYVGRIYHQGNRKKNMRMTHQSIKATLEGIEDGTYTIINYNKLGA